MLISTVLYNTNFASILQLLDLYSASASASINIPTCNYFLFSQSVFFKNLFLIKTPKLFQKDLFVTS